jgi:hypothetical protein
MHATSEPLDADDLYLVRNHEPVSRIVLSQNPTRLEAFAADELRTYIKKATGADLEIVADARASEGETLVCFGENRFTEHLAERLKTARTDSIILEREGGRLFLIGRDSPNLDPAKISRRLLTCERGTFNSVHEFLERQLGVRWYWPGEIGEVVPQMGDVKISELDMEHSPHFIYRASHQSSERMDRHCSAEELNRWWMRQRLGGIEGRATANHSFNSYPARFGKQHPEWFALQTDGKRLNRSGPRGGHVCFSNQELFERAVRDVLDCFHRNPTQKFHPVMPGGGLPGHFCQCEGCQAQIEPDKGPSGRYSKYVWGFVNRVAREVAKQYPDRIVTCCAYGGYKDVPSGMSLAPNVSVTLCRN